MTDADIIGLIKAAIKYVDADSRCHGITGIVTAADVKGEKQESDCELFDHEFVDQHAYFEDDFHGTIYLPMPNGEYLAIYYSSN